VGSTAVDKIKMKNQKAFTLFELLIVLSIFTGTLLALLPVWISIFKLMASRGALKGFGVE